MKTSVPDVLALYMDQTIKSRALCGLFQGASYTIMQKGLGLKTGLEAKGWGLGPRQGRGSGV